MQPLLHDIIVGNLFALLLIFMRLGMALMIMPGIGDSFVTPQVRLLFALAVSLVLTPILATNLPPIPAQSIDLVMLLISEAVIGIFLGTIMRIMMAALDTAGTVISMQSGFASALLFNPVTASQGSVMGSLYSMTGVTLLLVTNMHHYMLASVVESYHLFPAKDGLPSALDMSQVIAHTVTTSFKIGVQIAMPFLIVGLVVQVGFGILGRLMPQVQIFFLALPVQIMLGFMLISISISAGILFWLSGFESTVTQSIAP